MVSSLRLLILSLLFFNYVVAQNFFKPSKNSSKIISHTTTTSNIINLSKHLKIFVFISPECPLCKNYSNYLNSLTNKYSKIPIIGIISGISYSNEEIKEFMKLYKINFPIFKDEKMEINTFFHANTTPEVVFTNGINEVLYQGAIDDWVVFLGKKKSKPSVFYLENAIQNKLKNKSIFPSYIPPIGCLINDI